MKVLMFGWEFPPHITGGLGTASFGLVKGMSVQEDLEIIFVVPKSHGDEERISSSRLIGANTVPLTQNMIHEIDAEERIEYLEVSSKIVPYVDPKDFWKLQSHEVSTQYRTVQTNSNGMVQFTGSYGPNLFDEIQKYALVAELIARDHEFDLIHAHDWLTYPAGIAASKVSGKPLVVHVHATEFDRNRGSINQDVYQIEKEGMHVADHVITVSHFTRNTLILKYNIPPEKVTAIHNAVDPIKRDKVLKLEKGIQEKVVTFLGRITSQKGPEFFLEAASEVLKKNKNVRFVMAGSGDLLENMIALAASKHIADRFYFTGFLSNDEVYELLELSDVYVMPSASEPFGIAPLEALHANTPVIISKQSGVSEILTNAIKVDYWDIPAIADAIHAVISYPSLGKHLKINGKEELKKLKWKEVAAKVRKVYDDLLTNSSAK